MNECSHKWLPLINMEHDGNAPCGSIGSQIGYHCTLCGEDKILWPDMAARTKGMTEEKLMRMNKEMVG
jgi:hypothetical protein